ncbi:hypothetical protein JRO89_XSUnG0256500 [Xanthoceras sorbifolium]|uniref:YqaJ viral recombinase domain-containing protein n=1 Tax=Xanthoceras sorbifolium TaxID=99658 RepID=A0ABQ8GWM2_9ROSI|nr:hypothetical protein JRO89_XSUnG0256500 [Xanthoceras sorbifolium]
MQHAFNSVMDNLNAQNKQFGNAASPSGSPFPLGSPFPPGSPFSYPPPQASSTTPSAASQSTVTVNVPATKVGAASATDVKDETEENHIVKEEAVDGGGGKKRKKDEERRKRRVGGGERRSDRRRRRKKEEERRGNKKEVGRLSKEFASRLHLVRISNHCCTDIDNIDVPIAHLASSSLQHWFKNWQELRKNKLTASTFAAAVGFWRHRRVHLWLEKIGAIKPFSGNSVLFPEFQVYSKKNLEDDWLAASPDGLVDRLVYDLPSRGVLEIKCPFSMVI